MILSGKNVEALKHGALRNVMLGMARAEGREPLEMIWIVNPREVFRETSRTNQAKTKTYGNLCLCSYFESDEIRSGLHWTPL